MRITIAIFAALVLTCFSKPISSSVGARHVFAAEANEKTYTAADYVQDGLVAMWDGIENAGWGVHDTEATVWKDLIGENNLDIYGKVCEDGISNVDSPKAAAYIAGRVINDIQTIEVCHEFQGGDFPYKVMFCSGPINTIRLGLVHYGQGNTGFQTYSNVFWDYSSISEARKTTICATTEGCYLGGLLLPQTSHSADTWNNAQVIGIGGRDLQNTYSFRALYHCIRVYNRVLSEKEIAANYAIDVRRFNLETNE